MARVEVRHFFKENLIEDGDKEIEVANGIKWTPKKKADPIPRIKGLV